MIINDCSRRIHIQTTTCTFFLKIVSCKADHGLGSKLGSTLTHRVVDQSKPHISALLLIIEENSLPFFLNDFLTDFTRVLGPPDIAQLMMSLESNTFVRHFLLGNNTIGPVGTRLISEFMLAHPDRMETWYFAGNCFDLAGF